MSKPRLSVRAWRGLAVALVAAAVLPIGAAERGPAHAVASTSTTLGDTQARVIVKYKANSTLMHALSASASTASVMPLHAQAMGLRLGVAMTDGLPTGPSSQVVTAQGISSASLAAQLAAQSDVEYAVVDERVHALTIPSDSLFAAGQSTTPTTGQWYLRTPGGDGEVASINAEAAWGISMGSSSVVVAVVDTGITSHPDLVGKVLPGYNFISDATNAGNSVGRSADATDLGDGVVASDVGKVTGCTNSDIEKSSWHGTQTSGLIGAATNNGLGMASVGWNVMILPVRALGKCGGLSSDVTAAIRWAAGVTIPGIPTNPNPAKVINLSLGGSSGVPCSSDYQDAVSSAIAKGVVVVAAAGNDGLALGSPANCTGVIAVAGVRHVGTKVGYSDLGTGVTIAAPAGNCVNITGTCLFPLLTTSNDGAYSVGNPVYTDGDVRQSLGTSFSAPLVSGTVALMLSANSGLTPTQVASSLKSSARAFPQSGAPSTQLTTNGPFVPVTACQAPSDTAQNYECYCTTSTCGAGLLDAGAAVTSASLTPFVTIDSSASSVAVGSSVTFSGSGVTGTAATSSPTYVWTITSGASLASFSSSTNAASASVVANAVGTFTVSLAVTDANGRSGTSTKTVAITAAAATTPVTAPVTGSATSSSSSGGGSVSPGWLIGLLMAVLALFLIRPARRPS